MSIVVLDASVAVKWMLPSQGEPLAREAIDLLNRYTCGELEFIVPDLFWAECGNVFCKATRQGRVTFESAEHAMADLMGLNFPTTPSKSLLDRALVIATSFDRTLYDALYVALAIESNGHLVTADERLANTLASRLPVKWLGHFVA
ncbi:MAG TPA: type II toxin-antitoxin system VapC family toxin [Terriglobales bacterium]|nr:type II toxin-antitoxin system VapC family toxin [Terriglobales bacterium]